MTDKPVALVTGGAQGIGYACGEAIAEDGARVVLADVNAAGVEAAAGRLGGDAVSKTRYRRLTYSFFEAALRVKNIETRMLRL